MIVITRSVVDGNEQKLSACLVDNYQMICVLNINSQDESLNTFMWKYFGSFSAITWIQANIFHRIVRLNWNFEKINKK